MYIIANGWKFESKRQRFLCDGRCTILHSSGDFAVLLSTGMRPKMVLLANFFCACCCFVGLYIGILVSAADSTRQWIFAVTAGMFLYISLVDLVCLILFASCGTKFDEDHFPTNNLFVLKHILPTRLCFINAARIFYLLYSLFVIYVHGRIIKSCLIKSNLYLILSNPLE